MNRKNLVLKKLTIVSQVEKKARSFYFSKNINIIKSDDGNKTGKSTLLKSIYHTLGGDIQFDSSWSAINPISFLTIEYDNTEYSFLRHGTFFGIFDNQKNLIDTYSGITKGLSEFLRDFFNFELSLVGNSTGVISQVTPAFLYLPYYIDQDKGWKKPILQSFEGLGQFKKDNKSIIEFHVGIKPSEYYRLTSEIAQYKVEYEDFYKKKEVIEASQKEINSSFNKNALNMDMHLFKEEIERLIFKVNALQDSHNSFRNKLLQLKDKEYRLKNQLQSAENNLSELNKDYKYLEKNIGLDGVECPTCGTHFQNNFYHKYEVLKSVEECKQLIIEFTKELDTSKIKIKKIQEKFYSNEEESKKIEEILTIKKSKMELQDFIETQAVQKIDMVFNKKLDIYTKKISEKLSSIDSKEKDRKQYLDKSRTKEILDEYRKKFKINLELLNIHNLYIDLAPSLKESGSDLPRAILAYHYSIFSIIEKYSTSVRLPIIIDSYKQQDQSSENMEIMLNFILNNRPKNSQLLLGTVAFDKKLNKDDNIIVLSDYRELLKKDMYDELNPKIDKFLSEVINKLNLD